MKCMIKGGGKTCLIAGMLTCLAAATAHAQNLGNPPAGDRSVQPVLISDISGENGLTQMALMPGDTTGLYFSDRATNIWRVDLTNPNTAANFMNIVTLNDSVQISNVISGPNSGNGMRGLAFHPNFNAANTAGFGKLFTVHEESFNSDIATFPTPRPTQSSAQDSVLTEWTWDFNNNTVLLNSAREILRVQMPEGHHPMQQIAFNPAAKSDDADYGNLYVPIGDGGTDPQTNTNIDSFGDAQNPSNVIGAVLRINPLDPDGNGGATYSIPSDNVFSNDSNASMLPEIFAYGFRHPQTIGFDREDGRVFVADIGQNTAEEVNLLLNGGNYGFADREGTFEVFPGVGVGPNEILLGTRQADDFTYPVAQFDHINNNGGGSNAVVGGYVYDGVEAAELVGLFLFGNLSSDEVYYAFADDLANDEDPADVFRLQFHDELGDPLDFGDVVGSGRTLMRFGQDGNGEIYIFSQANGKVFRLAGTLLPEPSTLLLLAGSISWIITRRPRITCKRNDLIFRGAQGRRPTAYSGRPYFNYE